LICIYVAGPYRAATAWEIEQNVRRAEEDGLEVAKLGAAPLVPHAICRFFHGQVSEEFWSQATMALMRRCDAILLVEGWVNSEGTREEKATADREGIPVFFNLSGLRMAMRGGAIDKRVSP
jgi:hypothetical protein